MERFPSRGKLSHFVPSWVRQDSNFFVTINCTPRHLNQLCRKGSGERVLAAAGYYHEKGLWHCRLRLLMSDHLHAILAFATSPGMKALMSNWKAYLNRCCKIHWQRDFFDHRLRDEHELEEEAGYIFVESV